LNKAKSYETFLVLSAGGASRGRAAGANYSISLTPIWKRSDGIWAITVEGVVLERNRRNEAQAFARGFDFFRGESRPKNGGEDRSPSPSFLLRT